MAVAVAAVALREQASLGLRVGLVVSASSMPVLAPAVAAAVGR
jgi:hypothetical protein